MMSRITLNLKKSVGRAAQDVQAELPSMFTQGSHNVNSNLKVVTPGFNSQRSRSYSKSGGEFAMINVAPPAPKKPNWEDEEDMWDDSGRTTLSSRVNELRTIGGTLRFPDITKGPRGGK